MPKGLTQEEFLERCKSVHGEEKYDYSNVKYVNTRSKVEIICQNGHDHGAFLQTAGLHLKGSGCPKCYRIPIESLEEFIEKSNKIFKNQYDYSEVLYVDNKTLVKIICPKHGEFQITVAGHIAGRGCGECGYLSLGESTLTLEKFIQRAQEVHKSKYDYSQLGYKNSNSTIKIWCPVHEYFFQLACRHLQGDGCAKCSGKNKTTEEYIAEVKLIHGETYDYSKTIYTRGQDKIEVLCKKHGSFNIKAEYHKSGIGCTICKESRGEKKIAMVLAKLEIKYKRQKKFPTCRNEKCLRFDFYLKDFNLCVEYDGRQHFEAVRAFDGEKGLARVQKNDAIKNEWCKNNSVDLLRIDYHVKNIKDIESAIIQKLSEICASKEIN